MNHWVNHSVRHTCMCTVFVVGNVNVSLISKFHRIGSYLDIFFWFVKGICRTKNATLAGCCTYSGTMPVVFFHMKSIFLIWRAYNLWFIVILHLCMVVVQIFAVSFLIIWPKHIDYTHVTMTVGKITFDARKSNLRCMSLAMRMLITPFRHASLLNMSFEKNMRWF